MSIKQNFLKGIFEENPVFVLLLGMCPLLATSNSVSSAVGMSMAFSAVLILSNIIISLIRKFIPEEVRIPSYIVIISSLVTIAELVLHAYAVSLYDSLGIFIPLIIVNCIILGRAEAYASKNKPFNSAIDALGMSFGFSFAIIILASVREILGAGTWYGMDIQPLDLVEPAGIFTSPAGAFITLGIILAIINVIKNKRAAKAAK